MDYQYVFVQYYDILGEVPVPKDDVGSNLNYIRFKWEIHVDEDEWMKKGKVYASFPLDIVRERVHVVQYNALAQLLHDNIP